MVAHASWPNYITILWPPFVILRNHLDPSLALTDFNRMYGQYLLRVRLADSPGAPIETIPRSTLPSQEGDMPFMLTREQFPVKLCFPMIINKSQGQSLKCVGIGLRRPPFMHGQLFVTLSRVIFLSGVSALLPESTDITSNVVYSELFAELISVLCPTILLSLSFNYVVTQFKSNMNKVKTLKS